MTDGEPANGHANGQASDPTDPTGQAPSLPPVTGGRRRAPLGREYGKLWTATALSAMGDGMRVTALPLLAATLTRDPLLISTVAFAGQLPWLLFALASGALLDRWDRRVVMWTVDAARSVVAAALAAAVFADWATIPLLAVLAFLLGTGQTLFDTASQVIVPAIVPRDQGLLERANGRLNSTLVVGESLSGPPAGGLLFSLVAWVPFALDATTFGASSALIAALRGRFSPRQAREEMAAGEDDAGDDGRRASLRTEIAEGLRWLWAHQLLRTLALMVGLMNLVHAAWGAPLVLFAQERLGLDDVGYGLLMVGLAVGAVLGSLAANRITGAIGTGPALLGAIAVQGVVVVVMGLLSSAWLVGGMLALGGVALVVWNVITVSLRQAIVPDHLFGRVNGVYKLLAMGTPPLGALLGGLLAATLGLAAPFLLGGVTILLARAVVAPLITTRALDAARAEAPRDQAA